MNNELMSISETSVIDADQEESVSTDKVSVYKGMNEVFKYTQSIIDTMQQGEKIVAKDLAEKVYAKTDGIPMGNVASLVQMFTKRCKDVTVEIGRNGGIYKGGKVKRVDTRKRCDTCHQVIRSDSYKHATITTNLQSEETVQE